MGGKGSKPGSAASHSTEQAGMLIKYGSGLRSKIDQDEKEAKLTKHLTNKKAAMKKGEDDSDGSDAEGKARKKLKLGDSHQSDTKRRQTKAKTSSRRVTGSKGTDNEDGMSRASSR